MIVDYGRMHKKSHKTDDDVLNAINDFLGKQFDDYLKTHKIAFDDSEIDRNKEAWVGTVLSLLPKALPIIKSVLLRYGPSALKFLSSKFPQLAKYIPQIASKIMSSGGGQAALQAVKGIGSSGVGSTIKSLGGKALSFADKHPVLTGVAGFGIDTLLSGDDDEEQEQGQGQEREAQAYQRAVKDYGRELKHARTR